MLINPQPNRYVIDGDLPQRPTAARKSKATTDTKAPSAELPASTILLGASLLGALGVLSVVAMHWHTASEETKLQRQRASIATATIESLEARLTILGAERDGLYRDRRSLLRSIQDELERTNAAAQQANKWASAQKQAVDQTYQIAYQWADHSSQLEQKLDTTKTELTKLDSELKATRESAEQTTAELQQKAENLDREATGYYALARRLDNEASGLRSTISSLESDKSSLSREVSCLTTKVSGLESEISSLRCQLSNVHCSHCGR